MNISRLGMRHHAEDVRLRKRFVIWPEMNVLSVTCKVENAHPEFFCPCRDEPFRR